MRKAWLVAAGVLGCRHDGESVWAGVAPRKSTHVSAARILRVRRRTGWWSHMRASLPI